MESGRGETRGEIDAGKTDRGERRSGYVRNTHHEASQAEQDGAPAAALTLVGTAVRPMDSSG